MPKLRARKDLEFSTKKCAICGEIQKGKVILLGISVFLQCKSEQDLSKY